LVETLQASTHPWSILRQWPRLIEEDQSRNEQLLALAQRKGIYPYDYATTIDRLRQTKTLPPRSEFFNELTKKLVTEAEYEHALTVFRAFACPDMCAYTELYVELDCYLLSEAVLQLREDIYGSFDIDLAHYISLPSLSRDLMLKVTEAEPELLTCPEMVAFVRGAIRGGHSFIGMRMAELEESRGESGEVRTAFRGQPASICYIDVNNLCESISPICSRSLSLSHPLQPSTSSSDGAAMRTCLPYNGFQWMSERALQQFDVDRDVNERDGGVGYFL